MMGARATILTVLLLVHAATALAKPAPAVPPLLSEIEKQYTKSKRFMADFKQSTFSTMTQEKKESGGKVYFESPGKFRWETTTGDKSLLVSDGKTFWLYTPPFDDTEPGQVMKLKSKKAESQLLNAMLSGSFSAAKDLKIKTLEAARFELIPRKKNAFGSVAKIHLDVDPAAKKIRKVTLFHSDGNQAEVELTNLELGVALPQAESLFTFKAPPRTDVIEDK